MRREMNMERVSKLRALNTRLACAARRLLQVVSAICFALLHLLDDHGCLPGTVLRPADTERVALRLVSEEPAVRWRHQVGAETTRMQRNELSLEAAPRDTGASRSTQIFFLTLFSDLSGEQNAEGPSEQEGPRPVLGFRVLLLESGITFEGRMLGV